MIVTAAKSHPNFQDCKISWYILVTELTYQDTAHHTDLESSGDDVEYDGRQYE